MSVQLTPLPTTPDLVEQVHAQLVQAISTGQLAPGQRLTQEDLAERFAVSRQPVLQALRLLKRDGLVLDAPGRGVQVAPLTAELIGWVYDLRAALDSLAAEQAAARRAAPDAALIRQGRQAVRDRDLPALIEADLAFHQAIYRASGNPMLERSAELHWCHIRRAMGAVLGQGALRQAVWDEHEAMAECIAKGQPARARRLAGDHAARAGARITAQLATHLHAQDPPSLQTRQG